MHLPSILAEHRLLPDSLIRYGIRKQLATHSQWLEKTTEQPIVGLKSSTVGSLLKQVSNQKNNTTKCLLIISI